MTSLAFAFPLACPRSRATRQDRRMTRNPHAIDHERIEYDLDGLLAAWHQYHENKKLTRGYSRTDSTCRDYRAPGHWDWKNGAADARADELQVKAVDECMDNIPNVPQPWNTALQFEARNCATGRAVWLSPRLPQDKDERAVLVREARNMLLKELMRAGVLT
jgi:hypothetical protein